MSLFTHIFFGFYVAIFMGRISSFMMEKANLDVCQVSLASYLEEPLVHCLPPESGQTASPLQAAASLCLFADLICAKEQTAFFVYPFRSREDLRRCDCL